MEQHTYGATYTQSNIHTEQHTYRAIYTRSDIYKEGIYTREGNAHGTYVQRGHTHAGGILTEDIHTDIHTEEIYTPRHIHTEGTYAPRRPTHGGARDMHAEGHTYGIQLVLYT